MNWEHTDFSMAPRAGRLDELRSEAAGSRSVRDLIKENRSRRINSIRSHLVRGLTAVSPKNLRRLSRRPANNAS